MQAKDLAHLRIPAAPTLTPDGRLAAVALTRIDLDADDYRSDLWVVPTDGSAAPRRFTVGPKDSLPRFSPDGRWLAFLRAALDEHGKPASGPAGKPQLHVMPTDGGEPRRVTDHPLGVASIVWSPDSRRIAYVARVPEPGRYGTDKDVTPEKEPPRRITTLQYRVDGLGFYTDRRAHVFVVDALAEGDGKDGRPEPLQLTRGDFDHADPAWSPDGRAVAFVSARHETRDSDPITDVWVAPASGGDALRVTRTGLVASKPVFSPDGATIWFVAPQDSNVAGRSSGLWSVPADGSAAPERLTDAERFDVDNFALGATAVPLPDQEGVTYFLLDRGAVALARFPRGGGEPARLLGGRRQVADFAAAETPGGTVIAAVVTDATSSGELVVRTPDGHERTVSDFGATLARATSLRPMEELTASAPDGWPLHGWVVKPAGKPPFPVLLLIHGGPHTQFGYRLFDEAQVYAGAGYAVVMGNPRGSAGYGEAHGRAIVGDFGNLDAQDLLALLDAALADPELDASRVGVMGGSYGGFMTSWLLGHCDRFRAGISERAVNAFDSFEGSSDIGWLFLRDYIGRDPQRVAAQSPLTYADRISAPLLIIHSEQDWRCPLEQAQRLFVALKLRGAEVELLLFPGEGHELSRSGLPSHRVARFAAILDWWERHLKPAE